MDCELVSDKYKITLMYALDDPTTQTPQWIIAPIMRLWYGTEISYSKLDENGQEIIMVFIAQIWTIVYNNYVTGNIDPTHVLFGTGDEYAGQYNVRVYTDDRVILAEYSRFMVFIPPCSETHSAIHDIEQSTKLEMLRDFYTSNVQFTPNNELFTYMQVLWYTDE